MKISDYLLEAVSKPHLICLRRAFGRNLRLASLRRGFEAISTCGFLINGLATPKLSGGMFGILFRRVNP